MSSAIESELIKPMVDAYVSFVETNLATIVGGGVPEQFPYVDVLSANPKNMWSLNAEYFSDPPTGILDMVPSDELNEDDLNFLLKLVQTVYQNVLKDRGLASRRIAVMYSGAKSTTVPQKERVKEREVKRLPVRLPTSFIPAVIPDFSGPALSEVLAEVGPVRDDDPILSSDKSALLMDAELLKAVHKLRSELDRLGANSVPLTRKQKKLLSTYNALESVKPQQIADILAGKSDYMNRIVMSLQGYTNKEERNAYLAAHYGKILSALAAQGYGGPLLATIRSAPLRVEPTVEIDRIRSAFDAINSLQNKRDFRVATISVFRSLPHVAKRLVEYPAGEKPEKQAFEGGEIVGLAKSGLVRRPHFYKCKMQTLSSAMTSKVFVEGETKTNAYELGALRGNVQFLLSRNFYGISFYGFLNRLGAVMEQAEWSLDFEERTLLKLTQSDVDGPSNPNFGSLGDFRIQLDPRYIWDRTSTYVDYFRHMGFMPKQEWAMKLPADPYEWDDHFLRSSLPVYVVNLTAEEGLPFTPFKKYECMDARAEYNRNVYMLCQSPGVGLKRLRATFPHLYDYVAKPKKELYPLEEKMDLETALDEDKYAKFIDSNKFCKKTRTIGIPSCAAHLLNSLVAPVIKGARVDRSVGGVIDRLRDRIFSLANFQYGNGRFDLIMKRIMGLTPFQSIRSDEEAFWSAHFSDNIFLCDRGKLGDMVDPSIVQISACHRRYAELMGILSDCIQNGRLFDLRGLRYFASGDGAKMESGTTSRRARCFLNILTNYVNYPPHVVNFMRLVGPSLVADGRLLVGDLAIRINYMISGNPLTFTFNDFASFTILNHVDFSTTLLGLLTQIENEFGYQFTWERVCVIPELGEQLTNGDQVLDMDFLGYSVIHADMTGEYMPVLQLERQDRMIASEKRGDNASSEATYNKFLCAYFLGGWSRPAYSDFILRVLRGIDTTTFQNSDIATELDEAGIEREIKTFMSKSDMKINELSPQIVRQFFSGTGKYGLEVVRRVAIPPIPSIEMALFDPNSETLYRQRDYRDATRLLRTRLEWSQLKLPVHHLNLRSTTYDSELVDKDSPVWPSIVDAVGAKPNKTPFWKMIGNIVAQSHPELCDKFEGHVRFQEQQAVIRAEERKEERKLVEEARKQRKKKTDEALVVRAEKPKQPQVVLIASASVNPKEVKPIKLNRSGVVLIPDPVNSPVVEKAKFCRQLISSLWKVCFSKLNFDSVDRDLGHGVDTGEGSKSSGFGSQLATFYRQTLSGSKTFKDIERFIKVLVAPKEYTITECNHVNLEPYDWKVFSVGKHTPDESVRIFSEAIRR